MRKLKYIPFLFLLGVIFLTACNQTDTPKEETGEKESREVKKPKTFRYKDVLGNEYTAPLLESLPKHTYDYTRLTDQNGYKYYKDKSGKVISKLGIDVSKYQTDIDFQAVKESGIEFVMIRMGFRGYGEPGTLHVDEAFDAHVAGAQQAGLGIGIYFFSQAISEAEAQEEADFVVNYIQKYHITYPVVFDTEEIKNDVARTDHLKKEQYTDHCIIFCEQIKKAGYEPMIYANMRWFADTLDITKLQEYPKWYADYYDVPQYPYEFRMWQYSESGVVPGITGNVDMNLLFLEEK